jgi:hypothetical protein
VEAIVLTVIVRMAETVADAVDAPEAAGGIADAVGAVDAAVAAGATVADAAGLAGEDTKSGAELRSADSRGRLSPHGLFPTWFDKGHDFRRGFFFFHKQVLCCVFQVRIERQSQRQAGRTARSTWAKCKKCLLTCRSRDEWSRDATEFGVWGW